MKDRHADVKRELCRLIDRDGVAQWKVQGGEIWLTAPDEWPAFDLVGTYLVRPVPKVLYQNGYMQSDGSLKLPGGPHLSRQVADEFAEPERTHILIINGDEIAVEKV